MDAICGRKKIKKRKQKKDENKKELPKDSVGESLASTWIENRRVTKNKGVNTELPKDSVAILESSFNIDNPYPSKEQKEALAVESGLSYDQVDSWLYGQRKKLGVKQKKQGGSGELPEDSVAILETWFTSNIDNPYPSEEQIQILVEQTSLSRKKIKD